MTAQALSPNTLTDVRPAYSARPDAVFASRRRMIMAVSLQAVLTIFAVVIVVSKTQGPEAVWILVWWAIDLFSGGSTSVGRIARSVRIPLLAAVVVTGSVAVIATFTSWDMLLPAGAIAGENSAVFLIALWWTAGATAVVRAVIPMVLPQQTLRIVSEPQGNSDRAVSEVVVSGSARTDSDAFVAAVLAEVRRRDVERVELAFGIDAEKLRQLSWELRNRDVELYFPIFDLGLDPARVRTMSATGRSGLLIAPSRPGVLDRVAKRAFDIIVGGLLVVTVFPLLVAVAIGIKVSMPGPVFFSQQRVGRDSRPFKIFKFRSMVINADAQLTDLLKTQGTATQPLFKVDSDPRITRLGHLLRRSSIDELPQLFNVIGGSMSLVGPRPQRDGEVALYRGPDHQRLGVRPGMTGLWQVSGRSELGWNQAREFDLYYAHNWNLKNDLMILLRTFGAVVRAAGAQ